VDADVGWGRNNDVIAYSQDRDGVTNIWEQPIAGGPPRQLTTFTSGRIFTFSYSPDGARLLLAKGTRTGDVTLVRGFK
jgi:Tol biopolymer transport system component